MIPQISVQELAAKLAAGEPVYLLDVRQPDEHAIAALPNSTLIPLGELPGRLDEVDPPAGALVVVYCHHGVRSLTGALSPAASRRHAGGVARRRHRRLVAGLIDRSVPRY